MNIHHLPMAFGSENTTCSAVVRRHRVGREKFLLPRTVSA